MPEPAKASLFRWHCQKGHYPVCTAIPKVSIPSDFLRGPSKRFFFSGGMGNFGNWYGETLQEIEVKCYRGTGRLRDFKEQRVCKPAILNSKICACTYESTQDGGQVVTTCSDTTEDLGCGQ